MHRIIITGKNKDLGPGPAQGMEAYTPRERELMDKMDAKAITMEELVELGAIKRANIAHLIICEPR